MSIVLRRARHELKLAANKLINNTNGIQKQPSQATKPLTLVFRNQSQQLFSSARQFSTNKYPLMAKALVIGADGSESSELVVITNILRRAKVATKLVAADPAKSFIQCSCGIKIVPDTTIDEAIKQDYDVIILPGGLGARDAYIATPIVGEILKKQEASSRYVAAICAAPTALAHYGIGQKKRITTYPALGHTFKGKDYTYVDNEPVVVDGKLVTSQGPFTSYAFALRLVELIVDKKTSDDVKNAMLVK